MRAPADLAGCVRAYMTNLGSGMINGFSLLDLMLTLVIASLLAALAMTDYDGFLKVRKLNPLNTDFDLYSMGSDGDSKGPLSAKASRDDIVRANNGDFIGRSEDC